MWVLGNCTKIKKKKKEKEKEERIP